MDLGPLPGSPELNYLSERALASLLILNAQNRGDSVGRLKFIFGSEIPPIVKGGDVGATILVVVPHPPFPRFSHHGTAGRNLNPSDRIIMCTLTLSVCSFLFPLYRAILL